MKKKIIVMLLFMTTLIVSAQNYTEGYVLKNNGDTLTGWIGYRIDKLNAKECLFKSDLSKESQKFYPEDIREYYLRDSRDGEKYYISKKVKVENEEKAVFLDFLLQGEMNLYFYAGQKSNYYLLESEDDEMLAVTQDPEFIYQGADYGIYYGTDNKYKGLLKYRFKDYPEIAKLTDNTDFTHKSMIELVKAYHDQACKSGEECVVFMGSGERKMMKVKFSAYIGANYLSSFRAASVKLVDRDYDMTKIMPVIGVQANLYLPRLSNSVSLFLDISLSNLKGESKNYIDGALFTSYKINSFIISPKVGLRYTYPKGNFRPMVEAGFAYTALLNKDLSFRNFQTDSNDTREGELASKYLGAYLGAGVDFKLTKENFIFCRLAFEKNWYSVTSHKADLIGLKAGYIF